MDDNVALRCNKFHTRRWQHTEGVRSLPQRPGWFKLSPLTLAPVSRPTSTWYMIKSNRGVALSSGRRRRGSARSVETTTVQAPRRS